MADTCDTCRAVAECQLEDGWLICDKCAATIDDMDLSDAAWRVSWWLYPDDPAERVGYQLLRVQEVSNASNND